MIAMACCWRTTCRALRLYVTLEDVKDREALIQQLSNLLGLDEDLVRRNCP